MADSKVYTVECHHCHSATAIPNDTAEAIADDVRDTAVRERSGLWKALTLIRDAAQEAEDCDVEAGVDIAARHDTLIATVLRLADGALSERGKNVWI